MPKGNPNNHWRGRKYGYGPANDFRRRRTSKAAGPVTQLPLVVTLGVNSITTTSANVAGAVNPNGSDTTWWIAYGTSLPLTGASSASMPVDIGSGTAPVTVTLQITGLTTNATYYATVVGHSAAGTVYGTPVAFVPQAQSPTTVAPAPFGQPSVTIPHFNVPFSIVTTTSQSGAAVVEQDTLEEVLANVKAIVLCGIGECPQLPTFGRPDTTFQQGPIDTTELVSAIQLWEPRATEDTVTQLMPDGVTWNITLGTSYSGDSGV